MSGADGRRSDGSEGRFGWPLELALVPIGALGLAGWLSGGAESTDPAATLALLATLSVPLGVLVGGVLAGRVARASQARRGAARWTAPALGALVLGVVAVALTVGGLLLGRDAFGLEGLPDPASGLLFTAGWFAGGFGLGAWAGRRAPWLAGLAALGLITLALWPRAQTLASQPLARSQPELAAQLLGLQPAVWAAELAGLDALRHPAIYEPYGTDWLSQSRSPQGARVAVALALVLGCSLALAGLVSAGLRGSRESIPLEPTGRP